MYAFDIKDNEQIKELCNKYDIRWNKFIDKLIINKILVQDDKGSIVIYFHNLKPVHAGKLIDKELVVSKWGCGHLWQHGIYEVPKVYGQPKIFQVANPNEIIKMIKLTYNK